MGYETLLRHGELRHSRIGRTLTLPRPLMTMFRRPWERVLFDPVRNANPFFHLVEAIWMLAGRNDVSPMQSLVKRMGDYSDDGETFRGAYGHRWRRHFGFDQLHECIQQLKNDPESRRVVLSMWDARSDLRAKNTKDKPCNTHIYFRIENGVLITTVCCRSNDMIWGLFGSNAVHFSYLHELVAGETRVPMGPLYILSNNAHAYTELFRKRLIDSNGRDPYVRSQTERSKHRVKLSTVYCADDLFNGTSSKDPFIAKVATPVLRSYEAHKAGDPHAATLINSCEANDWRMACAQWLERRRK